MTTNYESTPEQLQADGGAMFQALVSRTFDATGTSFCLFSEGGRWVVTRGPHSRVRDSVRFVGDTLAEVVREAMEYSRG